MKNVLKFGLVLAAATGIAATISGARADTISVGWSTSINGFVTSLASGTGTASFNGALGATGFSTQSGGFVSPDLSLPALLDSNSINVSSARGGEIFIWITDSDIAAPSTGTQPFTSTLTSNTLTGSVTSLTLKTFYDAANGVFTDPTSLGSSTFTGTGTATTQANIDLTGKLYSITAVYDVLASGAGSVNGTINVAVPGPKFGGGLPGLLAACGGLIAFARHRRRRTA